MIEIGNSPHDILINAHAIAAGLCFLAGSIVLYSRAYRFDSRLFRCYLWLLGGMVVFLAVAMFTEWTVYSGTQRVVFTGLLGLGIYMFYRGFSARTILKTRGSGWSEVFVHHVGFTLISLFEGFVIVSALNAQAPVWLVGTIAVVGIVVGRRMVNTAVELERSGDINPS
jgi:uncharacterized membrane protein YobD (UPF0266 family)